jgi:hypothetical protein
MRSSKTVWVRPLFAMSFACSIQAAAHASILGCGPALQALSAPASSNRVDPLVSADETAASSKAAADAQMAIDLDPLRTPNQNPVAQTPATPPNPATPAEPTTRALPSPIQSPPFPLPDWAVNGYSPIGENWDAPVWPLQKALVGDKWTKSGWRFYGWLDAGIEESSSKRSNAPLTYGFVPNHPELDQLVFRIERQPDTVQTSHNDWGFRFTQLFGIDYRFTAGDGWDFDQLQKRNQLYGYDPVELFGMYYLPKVAQGMVIQAGRYISPPDIEAQLAPQNYLFSHSLMFSVDPYTYTGINAQTRFSPYFTLMTGVHAGNDTSPWEKSGELEAEIMLGLNSKSNYDSIWFGLDSIGDGHFRGGHDNMQVAIATWGHKFSKLWHMQTQGYYLWEYDAAKGGTEIDGPNEPYASGGGPGPILPGQSHAVGYVNYLEYQIDNFSYATFRTDYLDDPEGWRTGINNGYYSLTAGYSRNITPTCTVRPEVRYESATMNPAYDFGTRKTQWTLGGDLIFRF